MDIGVPERYIEAPAPIDVPSEEPAVEEHEKTPEPEPEKVNALALASKSCPA